MNKKASSKNLTSYTLLMRCGNNYKNHKGGCGALIAREVVPTLATIHSFNAIVIRVPSSTVKCNPVKIMGVKAK